MRAIIKLLTILIKTMVSGISGEFTPNPDVAAALHRSEAILHAPPAELSDNDALLKSRMALEETIHHLDSVQRLRATNENDIATIELRQAALWHCYAETERLRFARAITISKRGKEIEAIIDAEARHTHMHQIRQSLHACILSLANVTGDNLTAINTLAYLARRTEGAAQLADALSTSAYNRTSQQLFHARISLESASMILAECGLRPDETVVDTMPPNEKHDRRTKNIHSDPDLLDLRDILSMAENNMHTYQEDRLPPQRRGVLALVGIRPRHKTTMRHLLEHPAFTTAAPIKASSLLQL